MIEKVWIVSIIYLKRNPIDFKLVYKRENCGTIQISLTLEFQPTANLKLEIKYIEFY